MSHYLNALFKPTSVAVLGVSENAERGGTSIFRAALKEPFGGRIYAVGRSGGEVDGQQIYRSIADLPEIPDLVFGAVGVRATPSAMVEAAEAGVKVGVVFTAGFAEMSPEGARAQQAMVEQCNHLGMRIVGPNCMGVFDRTSHLNLTSMKGVQDGSVGLISQSGNIALTMFTHARRHDLGFHSFVSFGNQADVPLIDYLEYMGQDDAVDVVLMYVESLQEVAGADFVRRARDVAAHKPVVAIKGGVTNAGRRAAASHTSRLSAAETIYSAAFRQAGIVEVTDLDHLLAVTEALLRCPPLKGSRIAIVGSGGGHSTIGTDCVERTGLDVPAFDSHLRTQFGQHLPPWAPVTNPVDMTGGFTEDLTLFRTLMCYPLSTDSYDGGLSYGLYGNSFKPGLVDDAGLTWESAAATLGALQAELGKPIVFYTPFAKDTAAEFTAMRRAGVPCYGSLAEAGAALGALRERGEFLARHDGASRSVLMPASTTSDAAPGGLVLTEFESLQILATAGVETVAQQQAGSPEAAASAADAIGYPVVLKAQLKDVAHKSDVGGVRLGLSTPADVRAAFVDMRHRLAVDETFVCSVSPQLDVDREILLGIRRDETFGHTVVIGVGGILTEVAARVAVLIAPTCFDEFCAAIARSPIADFMGEWRGKPAVDLQELHRLVNGLVEACIRDTGIQSIDVNPLVTVGARLVALDGAVVRDLSGSE
ncbi:acetate--CoA ligase family protein [Janibacter melonis]|uniref:acetate--CoA ligase family protein n=1 Tax=Janibacter melonis TaxID=262209 RepID=UPI001E53D498|nr:acetate--CoA ligase family protein [Janibacter melonis]MCB5991343.1 acetate--CoA ligase family protein [Janibacter melonis]